MNPSKAPIEASTVVATIGVPEGGTKDVLSEILEWSKERPAWQRDALRRLFTASTITPREVAELVEICKSAHGLSEPRPSEPLKPEHLAIKGKKTIPISIASLTHRRGVNALASDQTIAFGPNLTIVYGSNAAGKSGYARILKRVCRSRGDEDILGNVLSGEALLKPLATIRHREGSTEIPLEWTPEVQPSEALASVSVFDSHSASVYLRDKTDVAFRPFGLDIFDKLSSVSAEVRSRLEGELATLNKVVPTLPNIPEGTRARAVLDGLTGLTKPEEMRTLAKLTEDEERRLKELRQKQLDARSSDPKQRSRELKLKAERLKLLAGHLRQLTSLLGEERVQQVRKMADDVHAARKALLLLQQTAITPELVSRELIRWQ